MTFICMQKIKFILHVFHEILEIYCKLVLGTLGTPGYANPKRYYQLVKNVCVHFQAKNQLHPSCVTLCPAARYSKLKYLKMPGTHKMIHRAAGYLKYKSYMPSTLEIYLVPVKLFLNVRQFKKSTLKEHCKL